MTSSTRGRWLTLIGLLVLALNLRPAAVSVGPVLTEITLGLDLSPALAGVLTSLPVLAFAVFGALAPGLASRYGVHRVTLGCLTLVMSGLGLRAVVDSASLFLVLSLVALAGMAAANVILPSLVKLHFPARVGAVTALYTTTMAIGLTATITLTVPVSDAYGGWRAGLGVWALVALVAAVPWLVLIRHDRAMPAEPHTIRLVDVARTPLGLAMAAFFGLQSLQAYTVFGWFPQLFRDNGYSAVDAGLLVGVLAGVSIPLSLWLPAAAARRDSPLPLMFAVLACYPIGYLALLVAPYTLALPAAIVTGAALCTFPLILTLISLRSRTPAGTSALSGFTQSSGYLLAATGPFAVGAVYHATGGWAAPLWLMFGLTLPMIGLAVYIAGSSQIEDQLGD